MRVGGHILTARNGKYYRSVLHEENCWGGIETNYLGPRSVQERRTWCSARNAFETSVSSKERESPSELVTVILLEYRPLTIAFECLVPLLPSTRCHSAAERRHISCSCVRIGRCRYFLRPEGNFILGCVFRRNWIWPLTLVIPLH